MQPVFFHIAATDLAEAPGAIFQRPPLPIQVSLQLFPAVTTSHLLPSAPFGSSRVVCLMRWRPMAKEETSLHRDPLTVRKTDVQIISPHRPTSLTSISRKILKCLMEPGRCKPISCQNCEGCFRFSMMSWMKGIHQTAFLA